MERKENLQGLAIFWMIISIGLLITLITNKKKFIEQGALEYQQHPEYFKTEYIYLKGDSIPCDTIVTYLK